MRTKEDIIQAIRNNDRNKKVYIHPALPPEKAAKYISAFANEDGGDIVLGVDDDGQKLRVKNYSIPFNLEKVLEFLNVKVNCKTEFFQLGENKLIFISVDKSNDLVSVNDVPYIFNQNDELVEMKKKKVFLSYCHDDTILANTVEDSLNKHNEISVSRDINILQYRDDLDEYMKTIRSHDFIVSIVTSKYLKSLNCMYEITELMKDYNFDKRLLFIIVNKDDAQYYSEENVYDGFEADIYDFTKRLSYIAYWNEKGKEMEKSLVDANLPFEMVAEFALEKRKLASIAPSTSSFMDLLKSKIGRSFNEFYRNDFKEITDVIKG